MQIMMVMCNDKNEPIYNSTLKNKLEGVATIGDAVYEFCSYRQRLKTFNKKRLQARKVRRMLNWTTEVVKAVSKES